MMPDVPQLEFRVTGAEPVRFAATPLLALKLEIACAPPLPIHSILLRCQVQIETTRRRHQPAEQEKMSELFGPPAEWHRTLRSLLWTQANASVPGFNGSTLVDLHLPCSYDFEIAAVKYLHALADGEIPLCLLFSGTVFYASGERTLQVAQIPWDKQASYRLPSSVWREVMDGYYPNRAWLSLDRANFDRLAAYQRARGLVNWDQAIEQLLTDATQPQGVNQP